MEKVNDELFKLRHPLSHSPTKLVQLPISQGISQIMQITLEKCTIPCTQMLIEQEVCVRELPFIHISTRTFKERPGGNSTRFKMFQPTTGSARKLSFMCVRTGHYFASLAPGDYFLSCYQITNSITSARRALSVSV
jgi:hypothetical protein